VRPLFKVEKKDWQRERPCYRFGLYTTEHCLLIYCNDYDLKGQCHEKVLASWSGVNKLGRME
jgi:hypothetical protein